VPLHSGNLWTTYQFHDGPLKGFGVGAGVTYVGEREANLPNTYKLDAYWRADAALFYEREKWRAQVNFYNFTNTHYYTGGQAGVFNATLDPGKPFTVQATISYKF
jgi:iron complex outermembrane receptor protein